MRPLWIDGCLAPTIPGMTSSRPAMRLLAVLTATLSLPAQTPTSIDWRTDLDAARAEALRDGKPLLAVFRCEP